MVSGKYIRTQKIRDKQSKLMKGKKASFIVTDELKKIRRENAIKQWANLKDNERKEMGKKISEGKGNLSEETKEKIRKATLLQWKNYTTDKERNIGVYNPNWKGDNIGITMIHRRIRKVLKSPDNCLNCNRRTKLDLCNIGHTYNENNLNEWIIFM